jgi:hypothetical protein
MVTCSNDDLGSCCGGLCKAKVVACIPVLGRRPLLKHTIERLYKKNGVHKVICTGHDPEDRKVCEAAGAEWVQYRNTPLGAKWNAAFQAAKKYNPYAVLFVGSSDWVSDNWCKVMMPHLQRYDIVGTAGCHFLHISDNNLLCYWPGYTGRRQGESIGIGRMISSRLLDKMQWRPFNDLLDSSLDYSMMQRCNQLSGKVHLIDAKNLSSVSISTDIWPNKHRFFDHYNGRLPSHRIYKTGEWIARHYPEANLIFKNEHANTEKTIESAAG